MRKLFIVFITMVLLWSCNSQNECDNNTNVASLAPGISVERLENQIFNVKSRENLIHFIKKNPTVASYFLKRENYPNDSAMAEILFKRFSNPHIDSLRQEIDRVFGDLTTLTDEFNEAFAFFKYYYPNATVPKIQTVATGLENGADLYITDSLIIIGLDFYLGKGAKYRPIGFPNYILKKYDQKYIVPSVMLLYGISPRYNATDLNDKTMLANMISYGKSYFFAKKMMPCTPDSILIAYSREEIEGSIKSQNVIWAHFLDNQLLYTNEHFTKQKYLGERPHTYEIGDKCPGRIGTWLGWEIVKQYAERNQEISLPELMQQADSKRIFQESKYRPGK